MSECYIVEERREAVPIKLIVTGNLDQWLTTQDAFTQSWIKNAGFDATPDMLCLVPGENGAIKTVLLGVRRVSEFWHVGGLPPRLGSGVYQLDETDFEDALQYERALLAWGLGSYQYNAYRTRKPFLAKLVLPKNQKAVVTDWLSTISLVRDLINTPTEDMGPPELVEAAKHIAQEGGAMLKVITGEDLLEQGFGAIHAVGRAGSRPPCLIDLRWGSKKAFKLTLVGKGVCFDSGGLDLKTAEGMLTMKKDMAGGAHALGLARMIMKYNLPVYLRVLIPAVENSVGSHSYRPGDVLSTRGGITVEVTNTDAEGRLVVGDALAEAVHDDPDLILDFTTLTGDARRALGPQVPALFANHDSLAQSLLNAAEMTCDPMWRLPLHQPYRDYLRSEVANMTNSSRIPMAGAIIGALFLQQFVSDQIPWAHFDLFAWNLEPLPGRPLGGEVMTLRAVFYYLQERFKKP